MLENLQYYNTPAAVNERREKEEEGREKQIRILFVAPDFPPHSHGGGGVVYKILAERLSMRGHKVTVIAGYHGKRIEVERDDSGSGSGLRIIWLPLMRILDKKYPEMQDFLPPSIRSTLYLARMKYRGFDVIHMLAFGHLLTDIVNAIARTDNDNKVLTVHAFAKYFEENSSSPFLKALYRSYLSKIAKASINSAKTITTPTEFVANEFKMRYGHSFDGNIRVIPNGISLKDYYCSSEPYTGFEQKYSIRADDIVIASIARIVWHKGFEYAIQAVGKLVHEANKKKIKYVIVGAPEDKQYYCKLIEMVQNLQLEKNVIFTGFVDHSLKKQILNRTDIFLAPSLHEGFGLIILEAMALGKPIVASNCEGFACILRSGTNGILVKPGNSEEIVKGITLLLQDPDLRHRLSKAANLEAKKYDWDFIVDLYESIYREIASSSSPSSSAI